MGADTRCDRSRIDAWRSDRSWGRCGSCVGARLAIFEERSWSSALRVSFSSEMVSSFWVTPFSSCEMVMSPLTS